jgi:hypothetical protein
MTHEELIGKFQRNAQPLLDAARARRLIDAAMDLEQLPNASVLVDLSIAERPA